MLSLTEQAVPAADAVAAELKALVGDRCLHVRERSTPSAFELYSARSRQRALALKRSILPASGQRRRSALAA